MAKSKPPAKRPKAQRPARKRVHELAAARGMTSAEVIEILNDAGFDVKAPASSVDVKAASKALKGRGRRTSRTAKERATKELREALAEEQGKPEAQGRHKGSAMEIARRNLDIFRGSLRGVDPYDLAVIHDLAPGTIREIIADAQKDAKRHLTIEPMEVFREYVQQLNAGISELAQAAASLGSSQKNARARGAVVKARIDALTLRWDAYMDIGIVQRDQGVMRVYLNAVSFADDLIKLLDDEGMLSDDFMEKLQKLLPAPEEDFGETIDSTAEEEEEPVAA